MSWKGLLWAGAGVIVIVLLAYGMTRDPAYVPSPLINHPAPDFTLEGLNGDTVRLADYKGKVVLVNFWASWCVSCVAEHELLVETARAFADQDVHILGVVYQDTGPNAQRWMEQRGGMWPSGVDTGSRASIAYGVRGVPETFFVARDGRVIYRQIGPIDPVVVASLIPRMLADSGIVLSKEEQVGVSEGWEEKR